MMSEQDLVEIVQIAVADLNHEENDAGKKSCTLPLVLQTSLLITPWPVLYVPSSMCQLNVTKSFG